jgi:hypothetical protein
MHEAFAIRLRRNNAPWPVDALFPNEGVTFDGETDAFPRSLTIQFDAADPITKLKMDRVRQINGWDSDEFRVTLSIAGGALTISGVDANSLPSGTYWVIPQIDDVVFPGGKQNVDVDDDQSDAFVEIDVTEDPRQVMLTRPVDAFDDGIRAIITAAGTSADGLTMTEWFAATSPRARRKACVLNLMAKLRTSPDVMTAVAANVQSVFFCGTERMYAKVAPELHTRLQALSTGANKAFNDEGTPDSDTHLLMLDEIVRRGWAQSGDHDLDSFRQQQNPSMQIVVAVPKSGTGQYYADLDIDLGNPEMDLQGFFIHMGELLFAPDTDHLALRKKLYKGVTKPYIYYDITDGTAPRTVLPAAARRAAPKRVARVRADSVELPGRRMRLGRKKRRGGKRTKKVRATRAPRPKARRTRGPRTPNPRTKGVHGAPTPKRPPSRAAAPRRRSGTPAGRRRRPVRKGRRRR